ncbi:MAG: exonuclease domain-containing protein [Chitinophagales bacterium]
MQLNLKRPIAFFDLETTGVNIVKDRIVEIGIIRINVDNSREERRYIVNPTVPIPVEAAMIHGIYDKDVVDAPTFAEIASEVYDFLNPCDLGGFNSNRFDVPLLVEEFLRCEINYSIDERNLIDVRNIFVMMEKRDLTTAYKVYCGKNLENAHSAMADVEATYEVFLAQLEKYEALENDMDAINRSSRHDLHQIDTANRIALDNDVEVINFGKYKGQAVKDVLKRDPGYYNWIMRSDFALHTKQKLKELKLKYQI